MSDVLYHFSAIRSVIPYAFDITQPKIPGSLRSVFVAHSADGDFICKFNHRNLAVKNAIVANAMSQCGIKVPNISVHNYKDKWFEVYPIIPGKTLYENIGAGMPRDQVESVYADIVRAFAKMDIISPNILADVKCKHSYQVAKINITDANNAVFAFVFSGAVRYMNQTSPENRGIYHCGITPKNIILDENGKFSGLVDMDEVAIADKNYAFGMMAAKYQQLGQNPENLINQYEMQTGRKLDRQKIKIISDMTNMGKAILWRTNHLIRGR